MSTEFQQRLGALTAREHKGLKTISELCGLSPDCVRRYIRGESAPTMTALIQMADYFDVSLDYLTGRTLPGDFGRSEPLERRKDK